MSMQAGIWHYDKRPVAREQLKAFEHQMMHGPDARGEFFDGNIAMLHRAFYITNEDALESQPIIDTYGNVLTWDGRLDNRNEILTDLGRSPLDLPTDAEIVSAALDVWDTKALPRFIGDWALARWNPRKQHLLLARDYIGVRKLYYLAAPHSLYWATDLAVLVLHSGEQFNLCDEYFAGYFATQAEPHLTPYTEIQLVPPGGYVEVAPGKLKTHRYWSFNSLPDIRYKSDAEYEEHFRYVFRQSVRRRMRTDYPILADLSGGLDSSSIVCMANEILNAEGPNSTLNTLSFYSLEEPGGDERPYFMAVEERIGKTGAHLQSTPSGDYSLKPLPAPYFSPLPGYFANLLDGERRVLDHVGSQGNRVHFSGLGGDELLGGVQNPVPALASLVWHLRLPSMWSQLEAWAIQRKTTIWSLLGRAIVYLAPVSIQAKLQHSTNFPSWLRPKFMRQQNIASRRLRIVADRHDWMPGLPSPDCSYLSLAASIAGYLPAFSRAEQAALPYYDRSLVQFLFAIPDEQTLRPHQRRSLMRRAFKDLLPEVVLKRSTKWLGQREPGLRILHSAQELTSIIPTTPIGKLYVDIEELDKELCRLREGQAVPALLLERVLGSCLLSRSMVEKQLLSNSSPTRSTSVAHEQHRATSSNRTLL